MMALHGQGAASIPGNPVTTPITGAHATYHVGPGQTYIEPDTVPWGALQAGDVVNIHYRQSPYAWKLGLRGQGTASAPIVINGVTDENGNRPVFNFNGARTASGCNPGNGSNVFTDTPQWGESLGGIVIKRGPDDAWRSYSPRWIQLRNLELHGAAPGKSYTTLAGNTVTFGSAAGLYIVLGEDILLENLVIYDNAFGIFTMAKDGLFSEACKRITVRGCRVYGNGIVNSYYEHNFYIQCHLPVIEGNYIGRVRPGSEGSSYKSRSSGEIFRNNWVDASARAIDWVYSEEQDINGISQQPEYGTDFAYGNVIVNDPSSSPFASAAIHYGGDNLGEQGPSVPVMVEPLYRDHLYFWNNTILLRGKQSQIWRQSIFALSLVDTKVDAWNNMVIIDSGSDTPPETSWVQLAGHLDLVGTNLAAGAQVSDASSYATNSSHYQVNKLGTLLTAPPQCIDLASDDLRLSPGSPAIDKGGALLPPILASIASAHPVELQPRHRANGADLRTVSGTAIDLGAFEQPNGYWAWIQTYPLTETNRQPLADPDGDRVENLLEYVLGSEPTLSNLPDQTLVTVVAGGTAYPALQYRHRTSATDVSIQVQAAFDLAFGNLNATVPVSVVPGPLPGTEIVTVRSTTPVSQSQRQFLRLKCTLQ
jgi:hypothetical protein